ncbi:hypothetical protein AB1484_18685 [Parafrankia sp. FMc6]|uniref:hypothetical protein n=1 Tax=Parafrankia soli TaxID=2599596 RepID=UPI0034D61AA6
MPFTPLIAVGALVFTFVNFLTYLRSRNWNGVLTQVIAWAAGVGGIMLAAHTQFAAQVTFGGSNLGAMDTATQIFLGLIATSLLTTVNELKKAIDNSDSARKAPLLQPTEHAATAPPLATAAVPADSDTPPAGSGAPQAG